MLKKSKTEHSSLDSLPWHQVVRPKEAGLGDDDGILELEEVEGVEIVYEETDGGRVAKFNVIDVDEEPNLPILYDADDIESEFKEEDLRPFYLIGALSPSILKSCASCITSHLRSQRQFKLPLCPLPSVAVMLSASPKQVLARHLLIVSQSSQ
ncbi:hypothetical protein HGRIS_001320 [Hohenbuehelia grisea]|uniref:Uncharacterized protein n=1 Tax=Hohenbuehelia grisea TaxID=104357 RepID=A0ABR3JNZ4_9AGAR